MGNSNKLQSLDFSRTSRLPHFSESALKLEGSSLALSVARLSKKAWYEEPQSSTGVSSQASYGTSFVPTRSFSADSKKDDEDSITRRYDSHCFLPAASQEDSKLIRIDFVCDLVVAYYGQCGTMSGSMLYQDHTPAVGMATYSIESKNFSYVR